MRTTTFTKLTSTLTLTAFVALSSAAAPNTAQACDGVFFCPESISSSSSDGGTDDGELLDLSGLETLIIAGTAALLVGTIATVAVVAHNADVSDPTKAKGPRRTPAPTKTKPANMTKPSAANSFMIGAAPTADGKGAAAAISVRF